MFRRLTLLLMVLAGTLHAAMEPVVLDLRSPRSDQSMGHLSITHLEAVCTLRGALARTTVTLTVAANLPGVETRPRMEAGLSFYLPPNCVITGASLDIGSVMRRASLTFKETAQAAYRSVVSRQLDPVLITMNPDGMIKVQVFPITPDLPRHVQLEFSQVLTPSPAGLTWEFPIRFSNPVPQATLTTDAPGLPQHGVSLRPDFSGGAEWTVTAPLPPAGGLWPAQPDETGVHYVQAVLPPGTPPPAPRHLLLAVEISALQRDHDAESERKFLTELLGRMGEGTVTLATYDTLPRANQEFPVRNGTCRGLFEALDALTYDGAPRPGLLKLTHIPADLTVIIGSLRHPMDRDAWPELPKNAPVMVLDSVSSAPTTLALKLAGTSGGAVVNPRSPQPPAWFPRLPLADRYFSDPTFYLLTDQSAWFVTAKLTGVPLTAPDPEKPPLPAKGQDTAAGQLTALHRSRDRLLKHVLNAPGSLRHALPPEWAASPYLSERTGFIVLEELSQYQQFKISLPPDLAGLDAGNNNLSGIKPPTDFDCLSRALTRSPGMPGSMEKWRQQLAGWKLADFTESGKRLLEFQQHRSATRHMRGLEEYMGKELYQTSLRNLEEAARRIPQLAALYSAAQNPRADLIRQSRARQLAKVAMMEILNPEMWAGMFRSSGYGTMPTADPFSTGDARVDRFFSSSAASDSAVDADPSDPFSGPATGGENSGDQEVGAASSASWLQGATGLREAEPVSSLSKIAAAAQSLHREGRKAEAFRTLSNLAAKPQPGHGALRFLAWQLLEWNDGQTAQQVLRQAEYLHGPTPITQRDLALIVGDSETLATLPLGVARRESAALPEHDNAALRILLECADEAADADLAIDGPDFETASWKNPLPLFGGALSFDGRGFTPEDYLSAPALTASLTVRVVLHSKRPAPVRLTIFRNWGRPDVKKQVFLIPECPPGPTIIVEIPAG